MDINASEWARLKELFCAVLEQEPDNRTAFLAEACADNRELKTKVEGLLARHAQPDTLFDDFPVRRTEVMRYLERADRILTEGELVSPRWAIEHILGRGGMGEVYKARDKQLGRPVAIKIMRAGIAQAELLARFDQEREILAALDHPNIARLFDAGSTADGRPYLVMEYVQGQPLDQYCRVLNLDLTARLRLFQKVCRVVQFSHQNLVVHRDLKPSNILVTGQGEIKLLDFGIAKLLHPVVGWPMPDVTQAEFRALTPDYASPEQVRGLPITTATDVYALGVILYLLLTGYKPYSLSGQAPHEMSRIICEQEPARPSAVARQLAGDLDAILLHALQKDPSRRYSSVEQFDQDIQSYLDGRPIRARRQTLAYRFGRFVQRNKVASVAALVMLIITGSGVAGIAWEAQLARSERDRAERRFNDVRALANWMLFDLHDAMTKIPGSTATRALLVQRALEYLDRLERDATNDINLKSEVAAAYERIGYAQGHPSWGNVGDTEGALRSFRKALAIREAVAAAKTAGPEEQRAVAGIYNNLGVTQQITGDLAGALQSLNKSLILLQALAADSKARFARRDIADAHHDLGRVLERSGNWPGARAHYREAMIQEEALARDFPADSEIQRNLSLTYKQNGVMLAKAGDLNGAFVLLYKALTIDEAFLAKDPSPRSREYLSFAHSDLGLAFHRTGNLQAALKHYRNALALRLQLTADDPQDLRQRRFLALNYTGLAQVLISLGWLVQASEAYRHAIVILQPLSTLDPKNAVVRRDLAQAYSDLASVMPRQAEKEHSLDRKVRQLQNAATWYLRSRSEWDALRGAGTLFGMDADKAAQVDYALKQCETALLKIPRK